MPAYGAACCTGGGSCCQAACSDCRTVLMVGFRKSTYSGEGVGCQHAELHGVTAGGEAAPKHNQKSSLCSNAHVFSTTTGRAGRMRELALTSTGMASFAF